MSNIWYKGMKGYTTFHLPVEEKDKEVKCKVCGKIIKGEIVDAPSGFGEAMSRGHHIHCMFECKHVGESWHNQAFKICYEIDQTNSPSLKKLMQKDLNWIIKNKKELVAGKE